MTLARLVVVGLLWALRLSAQQTVFNVPSADVLERGKIYGELDATFRPTATTFTATPRFVIGAGRNVEVGLNLGAFSTAQGNIPAIAPTLKWKIHSWGKAHLSLLVGDSLLVPLRKTSFAVGNYSYVELAKQFDRTRLVAGMYHFTSGTVASSARLGAQLSVEQTLSKSVSLAADWYSGDTSLGYLTPGLVIKVSPRVTLYPAYQLGNRGVTRGNHQFLFEVGWSF